MDVQSRLDDIVAAVRSARSMPMSASCVVNRAELLALLEELREALPGSLAEARELLGGREQMVAEAQQEARRIIDAAHSERGSLVSGTEVARRSQQEADRIVAEARQEADRIRAEADDYVDSKLANFEVVLSKTIDSVGRGKDKLLGRAPDADDHGDDGGAPERVADPRELRERADAYVETQFQAFEAVLTKTLSAVGRGRSKLGGHRPIDELGAHIAAQDEAGAEGHHRVHVSDADYLAGLADPQAEQPAPPQPRTPAQAPPEPAPYAPAAAYEQSYGRQSYGQGQDTHGQGAHGRDAYGQGQDAYGQVQDAYGRQEAGGPGETYDYPQQAYPPQPGSYADYPQPYADPYAADPAYAPDAAYAQHQGYPPQPSPYEQQPQAAPALDETSLFDTSMIDMEQLRRYEQGG
ncbi:MULTISPECIES: ATP synthase F0 subunit B [Streptomyces]|uniref:ATP synthase F0 subunit B n=1 Tax=Streptomyces TaxID=1883 RepID=UPI0022487778|nr:ATP synthase F0 subunit B [Streptomyces sp. JHD 1]MCX2967495.1 ATP synthase F0 subunit B [Streptomyces sp. JHD 1]